MKFTTIKDTIIDVLKTMESERAKNQKADSQERLLNDTGNALSKLENRIGGIEKRLDEMLDTRKAVLLILLSALVSAVIARIV